VQEWLATIRPIEIIATAEQAWVPRRPEIVGDASAG
jgi:hypothetical protein